MQRIEVPYRDITKWCPDVSPGSLFARMDELERHELKYCPWDEWPYKPDVHFCIVYTADGLLLKYYVTESAVRTEVTKINGPVWQDSCVEFFVSFDEGQTYYNLEFNSDGIGLIEYGSAKNDRSFLPAELVAAVKTRGKQERWNGYNYWELLLEIPYRIFSNAAVDAEKLQNRTVRANFYKCGDKMTVPHYVAWQPVNTPEPDFHQPRFFGLLQFES